MRDTHKGVIFLFLALLASIAAIYEDPRHWEMPFINFTTSPQDDVALLQAQLLAGLDPTENAAPTAAGNPVKTPPVQCLEGKVARDKSTDLYHDAQYVSIKELGNTYIELANRDVRLLKSAFETQSASIIDSLPVKVEQFLDQAMVKGKCGKIDLYLSKIKI